MACFRRSKNQSTHSEIPLDTCINAVLLSGAMQNITPESVLATKHVLESIERGFIAIEKNRITYQLNQRKVYNWNDPEEWVRCAAVCRLIIEKNYPAQRIRVEVPVPRRTPNDFADIVVYRDDRCREPYLVVENKAEGCSAGQRKQAVEQLFGNANSLRIPLALYDEGGVSIFFDVANHPSTERSANKLGNWTALPAQYGDIPVYAFHGTCQRL
jgi:type I restriction enzyme M protein